ncbi:MAG: hypothetical protein JOZ90_04890 [Alphaproteobacteria bacterium]|nr:hypothetical protein [Alphaproteobacteria bacterium]MBV9371938.1 hypothetical protein [Alphaproteobacteria bacterium]MBV9900417.1 hypothetical protein [Alphaproteobacteria bacterium]
MPRFFFNVFNDEVTFDDEGQELPDLAAARERAIREARALACDSISRGHLDLDDRIEVNDGEGNRVLTLAFRDSFELRGSPWRPAE